MKRILCILVLLSVLCVMLASCKSSHNHEYANKWSFDKDNHWRAAICEHTSEIDALGAHTDADKDGKCDVCKYALPATDGGNGGNSGESGDNDGAMDDNWDTGVN